MFNELLHYVFHVSFGSVALSFSRLLLLSPWLVVFSFWPQQCLHLHGLSFSSLLYKKQYILNIAKTRKIKCFYIMLKLISVILFFCNWGPYVRLAFERNVLSSLVYIVYCLLTWLPYILFNLNLLFMTCFLFIFGQKLCTLSFLSFFPFLYVW